jgi:glycine cleavage system H protein
MKEIHELNFPDDLLYFEEHTWVKRDGENVKIGISDYAQDQLGDIVFVELPEPGSIFEKEEVFGTVESVKSISELYMPLAGSVVSVNTVLEDRPELVNQSPYSEGWMIVCKPSNPDESDGLTDAAGYINLLKGNS